MAQQERSVRLSGWMVCCTACDGGADSLGQTAPTITQQPQPAVVQAGQTATFSVAAVGTGTLSYQWRKNGGNLSTAG